MNPYSGGVAAPEDKEYSKGYTRYSQDVLIPAFLAAYTGKDARTFPLLNYDYEGVRTNPFRNIFPLPNWRVNYNGLSRVKAFRNILQNFTLSHSYTGTLSTNSFNSQLMYRDVFAVPVRLSDTFSEGCNNLIKTNRAALIQSADDIRYILNWDSHKNLTKVVQRKLFVELPPEEQSVVDLLRNEGDLDIDSVIGRTGMQPSKAASALLNLEFEGIVRCLPGKIYRLC